MSFTVAIKKNTTAASSQLTKYLTLIDSNRSRDPCWRKGYYQCGISEQSQSTLQHTTTWCSVQCGTGRDTLLQRTPRSLSCIWIHNIVPPRLHVKIILILFHLFSSMLYIESYTEKKKQPSTLNPEWSELSKHVIPEFLMVFVVMFVYQEWWPLLQQHWSGLGQRTATSGRFP